MRSVKKFYTQAIKKEWNRLVRDPYHELEFHTTFYFLKKYLPKKGLILDAGGRPGRYTIELAKQGYNVILFDMTPANIDFAKKQIKKMHLQNKVKDLVVGSITNLSKFDDNTFDAVICLGGPLSHVIDTKKRAKAISELIRVVKKKAPVFISVMSRLSIMVTSLNRFPEEIEQPRFKKIRDTGTYIGNYGFTACHFFLPEELKAAIAKKGVKILEMAGLEGLGANFTDKINTLSKNKRRWKVWLKTHYKICTRPEVVGLSEHFLIVFKK
ncbi:MAG: class I SAM-dependent methyltransferase [Patescibacteria group bacterium]